MKIIVLLLIQVIFVLAGTWDYGLAQTSTRQHQGGYESAISPLALPGDYKGYTWNGSALAVAKATAQGKDFLAGTGGSEGSMNKAGHGSDELSLQTKERALANDKMRVPEPDMFFLLAAALGAIALLKRRFARV